MRTNRLAAGAALVMAGLAAGCGGGGGSAPKVAQSATATTPQGLTATLSEDRGSVAKGGAVTYTLMLTNRTDKAISFETYNGCGVDAGRVGGLVRVSDPSGATVYPGGGGCTVSSYSALTTLAPGQMVSDTFSPSGVFNSAGTYTITADFAIQTPEASSDASAKVGPLTVNVQ